MNEYERRTPQEIRDDEVFALHVRNCEARERIADAIERLVDEILEHPLRPATPLSPEVEAVLNRL